MVDATDRPQLSLVVMISLICRCFFPVGKIINALP